MVAERALHKWYIEPMSAFTNEVLAKNQNFLSDVYVCDGVVCEDGKRHKLWTCQDYSFVNVFLNSQVSMGCAFKVWHQSGNGQIRLWQFHEKKKKKTFVLKKGAGTVTVEG